MASARSFKPKPEDVGLETSGVEDAKPRPTPFAGLGTPAPAGKPVADAAPATPRVELDAEKRAAHDMPDAVRPAQADAKENAKAVGKRTEVDPDRTAPGVARGSSTGVRDDDGSWFSSLRNLSTLTIARGAGSGSKRGARAPAGRGDRMTRTVPLADHPGDSGAGNRGARGAGQGRTWPGAEKRSRNGRQRGGLSQRSHGCARAEPAGPGGRRFPRAGGSRFASWRPSVRWRLRTGARRLGDAAAGPGYADDLGAAGAARRLHRDADGHRAVSRRSQRGPHPGLAAGTDRLSRLPPPVSSGGGVCAVGTTDP